MPHALFQDTETTVIWDQSGFDAFMAKRDPVQEAADQEQLKRLFATASSQVAHEAFDWAEKNGMRFFIDHSLQNAGAYYTMGTGVVGLGARYAPISSIAIPMLVHEIRHGWQDKQGMIPTVGRNFAEYMIQIALMEADATAWESISRVQERVSRYAEEGMRPLANQPLPAMLAREFSSWHRIRGAFYGETASRRFGHKLGLPDVTPVNFKTAFQPYKDENKVPVIYGISTALDTVIEKLGCGFAAANANTPNYLAQPVARKSLENTLLKPRLAHRFFQAAMRVPPLVKEVNKAMAQKQRQHRKKHGTDLYL